MILRGDKVVLREKRLEDAYQDYLWRTDDELARLDATLPLQTRFSSYRAFYTDELQFPQPFKYKFAIDSLKGRHIGNCMYYDLDPDRAQAEVGIMIGDKEYWGQGYGADAVRSFDPVSVQRGGTEDRISTHAGMERESAALLRKVRVHGPGQG